MAHQDDYFYEIQLSNKQLVFYFMAGATGLILSFLAGVMVGRGADQGADVQAARSAPAEERVVTEETVRPAPPPAEELTYAQRLESEKADEGLEKPAAEKAAGRTIAEKPPVTAPAAVASAPVATLREVPAATVPVAPPATRPAEAKPSPKPVAPVRAAAAEAPAAKGQFTIQVGAFKDRASADAVMGRLKGKGFAAYVVAPATPDGLFNVRVGSYGARPDAERVQTRLRDQEKFKPFIVKN
ncbi:MAG TPA: SPOR domain-containing protein [Vicinamibacteria bacterium]|nr:SPOR domain-containing protein [Vicinamibacteria bacterium]